MGKVQEERKSRTMIILCTGIILPSAFFFTVTSDLPHVFIITSLILLISMIYSKPVRYNDRSVIYTLVLSAVLAVLFDLVFKVDENRFAILGSIFRSHLSGPFLLYLAAMLTFYESTPYIIGMCSCFSLAVITLGGDIYSRNLTNVRLDFLSPLLENYNKLLIFTVLIVLSVIIVALSYSWRTRYRYSKKSTLAKNITKIIIIIILPLTAWLLVIIYQANEKTLREIERKLINAGIRNRYKSNKITFGNEVDLNRTIFDDKEQMSRVILRARATKAPGYLRGKVYLHYNAGYWTNPEELKSTSLPFKQYEGILAYKTFYIRGSRDKISNPESSIYIIPSSGIKTNILLYPGNSLQIDTIADRLNISQQGVITASDWEKDGGYTSYVSSINQLSSYPGPVDPGGLFLQIPENIRPKIASAVKTAYLAQGLKLESSNVSDSEKIAAVLSFFGSYEYSLHPNFDSDYTDPVLKFIFNTKKGHCELFASATVLMLRQAGVPARYVTGFICEEKSPSGNYYVARLGNAHAWVEAFDRGKGSWVLVESTPPSAIPAYKHEWGTVESFTDVLSESIQRIIANMRRGFFGKAVIELFSSFFKLLFVIISNPFGAILTAVIIIYILYYYFNKRKHHKSIIAELDANIIRIRAGFLKIENSVSKKHNIARDSNTTVEQWLDQIELHFKDMELKKLLLKYQDLRYNEIPPDDLKTEDFINQCDNYLDSIHGK